jgi:hypothetical protein
MPYQTSPEIDFSSIGLVVDVPSNAVPMGGWSDSLNVRPKNGSVQGVNAFVDNIALHNSNTNIINGKAQAICQFTPAGSSSLVIAYIVKRSNDNKGSVVLYDTGTSAWNDITNATADQVFTFDEAHPPQIFVFNELLIVNPASDAPPQWTTAAVGAGSLQEFPNWINDSSGQPIIARILKGFNNRLLAMNIKEEHGAGTSDDVFQPIDLIWSSNITAISSLASVQWSAASTNTAGDAFLVDTPGKILDGGQLGEFFIAYKSDSVVRIRETGDSYVLAIESIFEDDGIYSTRCFANIGNSQHLVVGNYGVYVHDGQSQKQDIAKDLFKDTMYALVKPAERDRAFVFQQTRDKEVWFCLSSNANSGNGCDFAFVYDYDTAKLHKRTLPGLSDIFETELNGQLKIYATKPDDNKIQLLSETAYESGGFFERQNDNMTDATAMKMVNKIIVNSIGTCNIAIVGTKYLSDSKSYSNQLFNPASSHKIDTRASGRYMNLRVTMNGSTNPQLSKLQFSVKVIGVR